ncbi:MAG: DUF2637 domain-containing protein [Candidatus Dormibacteraceae bacterium]
MNISSSARPFSVKLTAVLAALVTVAGWALSYDALWSGALGIGIRPQLAWIYPLVVDGVVATCYVATFALRTESLRIRVYVWGVLLWAVALSVTGNALHAWLDRGHLAVPLLLAIPGSAVPAFSLALVIHVHVILARAVLPSGVIESSSDLRSATGEKVVASRNNKADKIARLLRAERATLLATNGGRTELIKRVAKRTQATSSYVRQIAEGIENEARNSTPNPELEVVS